ncbi:MAG TPA: methyltransferase domain-containing protein [Patescibacteria group bacterium]|jgi:ubiquinone/menaquinone biosynthesis C-methylase UbiE|nr:methyltransferase domain-containing protein [Patescibacteria group bacterium]
MKFINPQNVVSQMGLKTGQTVADLGSGAGFFALAAAKLVGNTGKVFAVDVQQSKLTATFSAASQQGFKNIHLVQADLDQPISAIPDASCDAVIMASILHEMKDRKMLFANMYRILKTGGVVLTAEWKVAHTIFGPPLEKRIPEDQLEQELAQTGLHKVKSIPADMAHYALLFQK